MQFVGGQDSERTGGAAAAAARGAPLTPEQQSSLERGGAIYTELCFACHGADGRGTPTPGAAAGSTLAPSLAGSPRVNGHRDYVIKVRPAWPHRSDRRQDLSAGHGRDGLEQGSMDRRRRVVRAQQLREHRGFWRRQPTWRGCVRRRAIERAPWTVAELDASLPRALVPDPHLEGHGEPRRASSRRSRTPRAATTTWAAPPAPRRFLGWTTGVPQQPGMWFQVELPAPVMLTELQFTSSMIGGGDGLPGHRPSRGAMRFASPLTALPGALRLPPAAARREPPS